MRTELARLSPTEASFEDISATLQARLTEFVRLARTNQYKVGVAELLQVQSAILLIDPFNIRELRSLLKTTLCSELRDWQRFDELFDSYWQPLRTKKTLRSSMGSQNALTKTSANETGAKSERSGQADEAASGGSDESTGEGYREGASRTTTLEKIDFGSITDPEQMRAMELEVERIARLMRKRLSRRSRLDSRGTKIDLRKTLRTSLRYGGETFELARKKNKARQPRLMLVLDVSRSMSMYSFLFLRFARGLSTLFRDSSVFAFHTQLIPITDALRQSNLARVRNSLAMMSQGWSGGTQIGEALTQLQNRYGSWINSRTLTVIVSDGFDTGEAEKMSDAMRSLSQKSRRILWINPLLGRDGYQAETAGMKAALPWIDSFVGAHNLETLRQLDREFARLA